MIIAHEHSFSRQKFGALTRSGLFFILFYLYLWLRVDLRLIYHGGETVTNLPVFFRGWAFFREFISYPSGPVEYLSAFLSQFLYIGWAGAVVITLQAWLICVCIDYFLKALNASLLRPLRFIPPILLLITYTQYTYHFVTTVALLTALLFVCLYLRITPKSKLLDSIAFLVLSVILYYIAAGAYLLFAILCAIYELFFSHRWRIALVYLLSAVIIPYIEGTLVFGVCVADTFSELLPFSWKILSSEVRKRMIIIVYMLYLLVPLSALGLGLWRLPAKKKIKERPKPESLSWYTDKPLFRWFAESCLLFLVAGSAVFLWHDDKLKTVLEADYYASHKMWPQVLAAYHRHPNSFFIVNAVNRALYHTGQLPYRMFAYHPHPDTLFLTAKKHTSANWKKSDIYLDLGVMNMAEGALTESLERHGEHPRILKRLALINMVKGNVGAARIYLGALGKTLFHNDWANNYLARLQSDPNLSTDDQIQYLRRLMMEKDYAFTAYSPERILLELLEKNRQNKMAFEYLMAWYMLTSQLEKFVQNLERLDDFDYPSIPRHYEEAMLIYEVLTGRTVALKGRQISPETYQRAQGFSDISNKLRNQVAVMHATAENYGDTYFFYYNFASLGIVK
jgi:hypothetical protein